MSATRNTIQRDVVYEILKSEKTHPSAEELFIKAKQKCPDISLATVYRHLKAFLSEGKAIIVETEDKKVHYDGDVSNHSHFYCRNCAKIYDIFETPTSLKVLSENSGFIVERESHAYFGICPDCAKLAKGDK